MKKPLAILVAAVTAAACTTSIPIRTDITIDAPREKVFAVLTDFPNYPKWNPYHIRVTGEPTVGAHLDVRVSRPDGKIVDVPHVTVLRIEPSRELTWGGGIKGIFHGEHVFLLEDAGEGSTKLIHNEDFRGIFVGFADLPPSVLSEGYRKMNQALKQYVENGSEDRSGTPK